MATPRTVGLRPAQRMEPARPILRFLCCALDSVPTVAMQRSRMRRCSPEGSRMVTYPASPAQPQCTSRLCKSIGHVPRPGAALRIWAHGARPHALSLLLFPVLPVTHSLCEQRATQRVMQCPYEGRKRRRLTLADQDGAGPCGAHQLAAAPRPHLHVVDGLPHGDVHQRQCVAWPDRCVRRGPQYVPWLHVCRRKDVRIG